MPTLTHRTKKISLNFIDFFNARAPHKFCIRSRYTIIGTQQTIVYRRC